MYYLKEKYCIEKYKNKFQKGPLENSESIRYADYALMKFFETAKKQNWFNNTLFVISADHASISEHPFFSNFSNVVIPSYIFQF